MTDYLHLCPANPVNILRYVFPDSFKKEAKGQTALFAIARGTPSAAHRLISRYLKGPTFHISLYEQVN